MVMDITDFTQIRPQDLASKAVIVVGTVQTIKTEEANTDSRKVYAHNENLEPHFSKVPAGFTGFDTITGGADAGKIRFSFVNLLRMHRPLVLVDEAHNNATRLGFEVFQRVNAACVVEFTATPASNSNILHRVSAMELKAEEMIKLPIVLTEHKTWEEAVRDSILTRKRLEGLCKEEDNYIRPIVLFQAENQGQENTWQVLKGHLIANENIPTNKIAVVTGDQRELDGINLFDVNCSVEFIITVQALKEGWDCSFAYVFCSLANIHSAKDVEQLLGRVLRMPYAKRRRHEDLNRAYAHVSSTSWPNAVMQLHDRLVDKMGFEEEEFDSSMEIRQPTLDMFDKVASDEAFRAPDPVILILSEEADIGSFSEEDRKGFVIEQTTEGIVAKVVGTLSPEAQSKLVSHVSEENQANAKIALQVQQATLHRATAPVNRGEKFIIPQLCLRIDGELELPDEGLFLYAGDWRLTGHAELTEHEFSLKEDGMTFAVDIEDGHIRYHFVAQTTQLNLDLVDSGWTVNQLSQWLDKRLRQPDIPQPQMLEFLRRTIVWLEERRNIPLTALARGRFILQKVLESKIKQLRQQAKRSGYQALLFAPEAKPEVPFEYNISFEPDSYYPQRLYHGAFSFKRHFFPFIGEMNNEEVECAKAIEILHPKVKYWVRNLERDPRAFRLPTSTDYFYPDFIAKLEDGRILVVEYKGEYLRNQDTAEKDNIGRVWASNSDGKCIFLVAWKNEKGLTVYQQIAAALQ
jgi:type III restriction enzyme